MTSVSDRPSRPLKKIAGDSGRQISGKSRGHLSAHLFGHRSLDLSDSNLFRRFLRIMFMLLMVGSVTSLLSGCEWGAIGYNKGYAPEQPIHFSHELHAGQYKIQCLYCHSSAERASHSAVPSLNICMNCHLVVATDKADIQKVAESYNNSTPVAWKKVHMLPDFVKFNHEAHVAKFGAPKACHKCHGPVESMETMYQFSSLSMGWCVNCHRQPENQAPVSCSTCHY